MDGASWMVGAVLLLALGLIIFLLFWRVVLPVASSLRQRGRRGRAALVVVIAVVVVVLSWLYGFHIANAVTR